MEQEFQGNNRSAFQWGLVGCVVSFGFVFVVILRLIGFVCVVSRCDVVIVVLTSAVLVDDDDVVSMIGFACLLGWVLLGDITCSVCLIGLCLALSRSGDCELSLAVAPA